MNGIILQLWYALLKRMTVFLLVYRHLKFPLLIDIFFFAHLFCCAIYLFLIDSYILNMYVSVCVCMKERALFQSEGLCTNNYSPKVKSILLGGLMYNIQICKWRSLMPFSHMSFRIWNNSVTSILCNLHIQKFPRPLEISITMGLTLSNESCVETTS